MAQIDQVLNETLDLTDNTVRAVEIGIAANDVLSVSADAIALAMTYQYALADTVVYSDSVLVETHQGSFAMDEVAFLDFALSEFEYERSIFEGMAFLDMS